MKRKLIFIQLILSILLITLIFIFSNITSILYFPITTPIEWCENQPCVVFELFSQNITIVQPSSTILVYFLGVITIFLGLSLLRNILFNKFVSWWGIALLLWGLGAIVAGTSYQIFSYELKCAGRSFCIWTSMWEIVYLMFSVGSINAMLIAQANINNNMKYRDLMIYYGLCNYFIYLIIIFIGVVVPIQFLISFELMILLLAPTILYLLVYNIQNYNQLKEPIYRSLIFIFSSLILIIGIYFLYFMLDITAILWEQGIWFSENDVLHPG